MRGRKGEYRKEIQDLQKRGFQRIKIDGELYLIEDAPALDKKLKHDIEVVDRVAVKTGVEQRAWSDLLETALGLSDGLVFAEDAKSGDITTFSAKFACPISGFTIDEVEPRLFSFNNPFGACPKCDGLGHELYFDPDLVVPDHSLSLKTAPWRLGPNRPAKYYMQRCRRLAPTLILIWTCHSRIYHPMRVTFC